MIVEDGTGVADSNSYSSLNDAIAYCDERGLVFAASPSETGEEALVRGSAAIDATYGGRFPGYRNAGRDQGMEWPRAAAYDRDGFLIPNNEVPIEVFQATVEAAVREYATPGCMAPDLKRGGMIQSLKAGSVGITYAANATARTAYTIIDGILGRVLTAGSGGGLFGRAERG